MNTYEHDTFGRVRVIVEDGEPWFCSRDITNALGYRSTHVANYYTIDEERRQMDMPYAYGTTSAAFINKRGLERICTGTTKPNGEALLEWLTVMTAPKPVQLPNTSDEDTPLSRLETICELYVKGNNKTKDVILNANALNSAQQPAFLTACRTERREINAPAKEIQAHSTRRARK